MFYTIPESTLTPTSDGYALPRFSKAVDSVDHKILIEKLQAQCVSYPLLLWFENGQDRRCLQWISAFWGHRCLWASLWGIFRASSFSLLTLSPNATLWASKWNIFPRDDCLTLQHDLLGGIPQILGGGVLYGSQNPDPISDQIYDFSYPFSDLIPKICNPFQT